MNYYIQGDAAKAEQIKAAFKRLGYDVTGWHFTLGMYYTLNGKIVNTHFGSNEYKLVLNNPDYKELELPVEPEFKVGDWIANDYCAGKVIALTDDAYLLDSGQGIPFSCEHNAHLWTIQDAKDGDVLVTTKIRNCPFIYRKTSRNNGLAYYYAGVDGDGNFCEGCLKRTLTHFGSVENVVPATKEQRELFFSKMKEAGYEWDENKKEVKKIQHYDIANFQAGMPVLVRDGDCDDDEWTYALFSHYNSNRNTYKFSASGDVYLQCIPLNEKTKYLLGTTDMCPEEYINW